MSLRDLLDTRNNALNFVRLVLAGLVIVGHTWPLGGFGAHPHVGGMNLGTWAVAGFFSISGYLITGSRMNLSLRQFALRRALRIYPGFWVCLVVVAFVFAPLAAMGKGVPFDSASAVRLVWSDATTVLSQVRVGTELGGQPYADVWNGSLWTLQIEVGCYVLLGLPLCSKWARRDLTLTAVGVFVALTSFNVATAHVSYAHGILVDFLQFAAFFAAGSFLWSVSDRVRVNRWWVAGSVCALAAFAVVGVVDLLGALPLAYLVLAFGAWCPVRWGVSRDLSYGVYIYAFPVQQVLAMVGVQRFGPVLFIVAAVAMVLPLALVSWMLVERPALRLVRRRTPVAHLADGALPARVLIGGSGKVPAPSGPAASTGRGASDVPQGHATAAMRNAPPTRK